MKPPRGVATRWYLTALVAGVILPLAIASAWLLERTRGAGESIVANRLDRTLDDIAESLVASWLPTRTVLLDFADSRAVRTLLEQRHSPADIASERDTVAREITIGARAIDSIASTIVIRNRAGQERWRHTALGAGVQLGTALHLSLEHRNATRDSVLGTIEVTIDARRVISANLADRLASYGGVVRDTAGRPLVNGWLSGMQSTDGRVLRAGTPWLMRARSLGEPPLGLAIAAPLLEVTQPLSEAALYARYALVLLTLGAIIWAMLLSKRLSTPLHRLAVVTGRVASGDESSSIPADGPAELRTLSRSFGAMQDSLHATRRRLAQHESMEAVGEFAGMMAHEVRNPLTAIRVDLERAQRGDASEPNRSALIENALLDIERVEQIVASTLRLARGSEIAREALDIQQPLQRAVRELSPDFDARSVRLVVEREDFSAVVYGSAIALEQMFVNLLRNALEASTASGIVRVLVRSEASNIVVSVEDTGPGFTPEAARLAGHRRFTTKHEGHGFGLRLARRIAETHEGVLTIDQGDAGAVVRVTFPLAGEALS